MARMTNTSFMTGIKNWVLGKIANIMALIPNQASSSNQLADKNFVNSSIATATATFRGTYNVVSDLSLSYNATHAQIEAALVMKMAALSIVADNNDYAFVQIPTSDATPTEIAMIEKYKYDGTAWAFEYELNNSGFTAAQWAAINSGATLELIGKLSALPTNAELITILNSKASKAANPTAGHLASLDGSGNPTDSGVGIEDNGAYDVTLHNNNAKFASLSELLNSANLNTLIPVDKRYGGMSIKFVQSSDNKYVQFRLMSDTFTTDITQWAICDVDVYVDNPEFIRVYTDSEKRILWAIRDDGNIYYGAGVPQQIIDYINEKIAELSLDEYEDIVSFLDNLETGDKTLQDLLNEKVDKVDGKSLIPEQYIIEKDNPEFVKVLTDSNKRIIVAIRDNGDVYYGYGVPSQIIEYVQEYVQSVKNEILDEISKYNSTFDNSESVSNLGNLQMTEPEDVDYFVILMYGQSLSMGDETIAAFAEENVADCLMLGDNIRSTTGSALNVATYGTPNENGVIAGKRQDAVTTAVKSFISLYKKERPYSKTKFIIGSIGVSGASLAELSGATRYPNCANHYLDSRVAAYFNALNSIAEQEEKTICLGAVLWMQGEADYGVPYIYKTYAEWLSLANEHISERPNMMMWGSKDAYYQGLKYLKEDIESLANSIFGQSKKPNFFAYSTAGAFINNAYMTINSATTQLADDTDNFFLLAPTYQTPDFEGGHLTMNGYRWYGEYIAKALYNVYIKRLFWNPLRPTYFKVIGNKIYIYYSNGVWPLVLNTWTAGDTYKNYGFTVRTGTVAQLDQYTTVLTNPRVTITNIQVISKNCIEITCDVAQFGEAIEIIYAGQGESGYTGHNQGAGNVCDSDRWKALFTYKNDEDEHSEVKKTSYWSGYTEATQEEAETLDYWDEDTTYNTGDKCLVGDFTLERPRVVTSIVDSNNVYPYNRINNRPTTKTGGSIVGELYPMQNWCINFYKRIIL